MADFLSKPTAATLVWRLNHSRKKYRTVVRYARRMLLGRVKNYCIHEEKAFATMRESIPFAHLLFYYNLKTKL